MKIQSIAFDLDDTLLDTSGILAPKACSEAFQILIKAGLKITESECESIRVEMIKKTSHKDVFKYLVDQFGSSETYKALELATERFYHPKIPNKLPLLDGAIENIKFLSKKYNLYIVTAGLNEAQQSKVNALEIRSFFKDVMVVNSLKNERKFDAFRKILEIEHISADQLLCIGNSLSSEIKDARLIGAWACYFEFGEDRGYMSTDEQLKPHYHIKNHKELITTCKL
ncbi:MAG: HAD hydrolase-like protein [Pseudobdellovibrio sp.]